MGSLRSYFGRVSGEGRLHWQSFHSKSCCSADLRRITEDHHYLASETIRDENDEAAEYTSNVVDCKGKNNQMYRNANANANCFNEYKIFGAPEASTYTSISTGN
jgi:hypothetical protein